MKAKAVNRIIVSSLVVLLALAVAGVPGSPAMAQDLPSAPILLSPANYAMIVGTSVTFEWMSVPDATSYLLIVNTIDKPFQGTPKFAGYVGGTQYADTGYPDNGTTFYWWVWAEKDGGLSPWPEVEANRLRFQNGYALHPPTLLSPANDAMVAGTSIDFEWENVPGATSYLLIVNTIDKPFQGTAKFAGYVGGTQYTDTGYPDNGTTFYWWVWAEKNGGLSPWPEVEANHRSFKNGTPLHPPTLLSPANDAIVAGPSVTFEWESVPDATSYLLIVNTIDKPLKGTPKFVGYVGGTQYTDTGYPDNGTTYYWWVWAEKNGTLSPWPEVEANRRSFQNGVPLPAPTLISPANDAIVAGPSVTFEWESVPDATSYLLIVNTVNKPLQGTPKSVGYVGGTQYTDTGYLNDNTTYYWWVWAEKDGGLSPWPEVEANRRSFRNGVPLPAPTLISPANDATVAGTSVAFEWESVPDATSYLLIVNTVDEPFQGTPKFSGYVGGTQYTDTGYPDDGTRYYWWVWSERNGDLSPWPDVQAKRGTFVNSSVPTGPIHNINTDEYFSTIQTAIDDPDTDNGHTIDVPAGTYNENVIIDKSLILRGAQWGVDASGGRTGAESVINADPPPFDPTNPTAIEVSSDLALQDVTIDGFTIIGSRGVVITTAKKVQFINNIVEANDSTYTTNRGSMVFIGGDTIEVIVQGNDISPTIIQSANTEAIRTDWTGISSIFIDNNHFHNATKSGLGDANGDPYTSVLLTNNEIDNNGGAGISIEGSQFSTFTATDNYIHDNGDWGITFPVNVSGNVTINYNGIENNGAGGLNGIGVIPGPVDGTYNWWGTIVESEIQAMLNGNVDYDPWLYAYP